MNIFEIAHRLNVLATATAGFKDLQLIRSKLKGLNHPRTYRIFSKATIFGKDDDYAFHDGGRSELQFNIGVENTGEKEIFRYGLAFPLSRERPTIRSSWGLSVRIGSLAALVN
ncbi:MAG TPA: hypothetical protein VK543_07075 [Puia sp.]|nr:hypothetical protein [Puia sp.]